MIKIKPINKFKIFKSDAAPFFFYIEIFPPDLSMFKSPQIRTLLDSIQTNPIMPLPMRVDRVFNGEQSVLIRPREPISLLVMDDINAIINPAAFLQFGIEKLLYFTEVRAFEKLFPSLNIEKVKKWWDSTKFLYSKLLRLEEDFSAFIKAYIHTMVKAKLNEEDLVSEAIKYCQIVSDSCNKRIKENSILIEKPNHEIKVSMYKEKVAKYYKKFKKVEEVQYHPELVDIDVFDLSERGFNTDINNHNSILDELRPSVIKYIPLLFYDDLLECMLQNLKKLDDGEENLLDPSLVLDTNVIILQKSEDLENLKIQNYSWFSTFDTINLESIVQSIATTKYQFFKSYAEHDKRVPKFPNS